MDKAWWSKYALIKGSVCLADISWLLRHAGQIGLYSAAAVPCSMSQAGRSDGAASSQLQGHVCRHSTCRLKLAASVPCSMSQAGLGEQGAASQSAARACLQLQGTQMEASCCCALQPGARPHS